MTRMELPQVDLCQSCGKCCEAIGLPPFEVRNPDLGRAPVVPTTSDYMVWARLRDMDTFARMPAELRAGHAAVLLALDADPSGTPCAWYDMETKQCRHYEFRPAVCVAFHPMGEGCGAVRGVLKEIERWGEMVPLSGPRECVWQYDNAPERWRNPRVKHDPGGELKASECDDWGDERKPSRVSPWVTILGVGVVVACVLAGVVLGLVMGGA